MEQRRDQGLPRGPMGSVLTRVVWIAGAVPAVVYGAAIRGVAGAVIGVVLWAVVCILAAQFRRLRGRHQDDPGTASDVELFDQLRMAPCAMCGSPTLLDLCLDCAEGPSPQRRHGWDGAPPRDEPDDPVR